MKTVTKIEPAVLQMPERKKVAAYARVSMETERLQHSLSAQISYYSELIQKHPDWQYAGVYADNGIREPGPASVTSSGAWLRIARPEKSTSS